MDCSISYILSSLFIDGVLMELKKYSFFCGLSWSELRDLFIFARTRLKEERLSQVAGSLTYTTVLSLVPMLTIGLAIFTFLPLFSSFRSSLEVYLNAGSMPHGVSNTVLTYLTQFTSRAKSLSAVGGVVLLVTALMMMFTVDKTLNQIWRVKARRSYLKNIVIYWAAITLGPLLMAVSITLTSYLFAATSGITRSVPLVGTMFYSFLSIALSSAAFTLLYVIVPNRWVDVRDAAWGGVVAAIAFEVVKHVFAGFVGSSSSYTMVYGALAAVPIFLVWIYLAWLIVLFGALLAASLPIIKYERWRYVAAPGAAFVDAMAILEVLYHSRMHDSVAMVDVWTIRTHTRLGFDEIAELLQKMYEANWVGCMKVKRLKQSRWSSRGLDGQDGWLLVVNPDKLILADVYRMFVFDARGNAILAKTLEEIVEQGLQMSIAHYFSRNALH